MDDTEIISLTYNIYDFMLLKSFDVASKKVEMKTLVYDLHLSLV